MKVEAVSSKIPEIKLFFPVVFQDERGYFFESFKKPVFEKIGIKVDFVQENCSFSCKDTLRGMHFQSEPGQDKLVHVSQGEILDVVVDIRPHSPTFKEFLCIPLKESIPSFLWVPKGFAHGFLVLSKEAKVHYKVSSLYDFKTEKGFFYKDLPIPWPCKAPILSTRDKKAPSLEEALGNLIL